jgi:periplasmic protein TonB
MQLAPYYREYELPWEGDEEASARFRKILRILLILLLLFTILFLVLPKAKAPTTPDIPQRLARVMLEEQAKPPPPAPKVQEKPKIEPKIVPVTPPVDQKQKAHEKAQKQLNQVKDELADLREIMDTKPLEAKNLTGAVGADAHAERSLITSKVGVGSGGITSADTSRGFGGGAGSLTGHETTAVSSGVAKSGLNSRPPAVSGGGGKAARSREEIELIFDRNKGRLDSIYARAQRDNAELQGKLVLELTITPSGDVAACRVISSELKDAELERKIIALVRTYKFEAKDVDTITVTKPLEFFPA